jgi:glycosyltransferase involved in cell wall biosynthesis
LKDKILCKQLKKYVDRIVTYSKHEKIFDIPTVHIVNGIDCSLIPIINKVIHKDQIINLIIVAQFSKWHGYDRLINGLYNYYKQGASYKVYIHFVGDGIELSFYKNLVQQYNLLEYIFFHGLLFGDKITEIFNKSDIAVCSLGGHRKELYLSSELKSREYLVRGMPMISSTKIDVLPDNFKYCLYVPEDESPINILTIVQFYQNLIAQKDISKISSEIRQFAENYCDMSITMKPVIDYLSYK